MIFRRGGKIKKEETFYFEKARIEIVNSYKYLGVIFTPCLKWSTATTTISQQASKALVMINIYDRKCGELTFDVAME